MTNMRSIGLVLVACCTMAMAACGNNNGNKDMAAVGDQGGGGLGVTVGPGGSFTFSPASLSIKVGDTVTWTWATGGHDVVSCMPGTPDGKFCSPSDTAPCDANATPVSNAGATYKHTFTTAGTFPYFCRPHAGAGMTGTITVQ